MLLEYMLLCSLRLRDLIFVSLGNRKEFRMPEHLPADQRHIPCTCIVIRIMKPACIHKIRISAAQLLAAKIHLLDKPVIIMPRILSDIISHRVCRLVRRRQKSRIQRLFQRDLVSFFHTDGRLVRLQKCHAIMGEIYRICKLSVFQCDQRRQYLCNARRKMMYINIFCIQDTSGLHFHNNGSFSVRSRSLRPSLDIVRLDRQCIYCIQFLL